MKMRKRMLIAATGLVGWTSQVSGQLPVPPAPGLPGIAPGPVAPTPPKTLWGFLGLGKEQKEFCKRKLCATPLGQLLNNSTLPLQALSGGLISPCCPLTPTIAELADQGAVGAAAKIKLDEAGVKARKAAVRYLGTVDCHYWPEAEDGLIGALRGDRSECVRFEAALALGNGCCCTKKTIEALTIVVSCSNRDGAPKENSERVHAAAQRALDHCLACFKPPTAPATPEKPIPEGGAIPETERKNGTVLPVPNTVPAPDAGELKQSNAIVPGEAKLMPGGGVVQTTAAAANALKPTGTRPVGSEYYARIAQTPLEPILAEARRTAAAHSARTTFVSEQSLAGIVAESSAVANATAPRTEQLSERPANLWDWFTSKSDSVSTEPVKSEMATKPAAAARVATKKNPTAPVDSGSRVSEVSAGSSQWLPMATNTATQVLPAAPAIQTTAAPRTAPAPATPYSPISEHGAAGPAMNPVQTKPAEPASPRMPAKPTAPVVIQPQSPPVIQPAQPKLPVAVPMANLAQDKKAIARVVVDPALRPGPIIEQPATAPTVKSVPTSQAEAVLPKAPARPGPLVATPPTQPVIQAVKTDPTKSADPVLPRLPPSVVVLPPDLPTLPAVDSAQSKPAPSRPAEKSVQDRVAVDPTPKPILMPSVEAQPLAPPARSQEAVAQPSSAALPIVPQPMPMAPQMIAPPEANQPTARARKALDCLQGSASTQDRRASIEALDALDFRSSPELVHRFVACALATGPTEERQTVIRALVRGRAKTAEVIAALEQISRDPTPAIRAEGTIGLAVWNITPQTSANSAMASTHSADSATVKQATASIIAVHAAPKLSTIPTAPLLPMPSSHQASPVHSDAGQPTERAQKMLDGFSGTVSAVERRNMANSLDAIDLRSSPELVRKLMANALENGPDEERQAFIRALVRGRAKNTEVVTALEKITHDPAPAIRAEATLGLAYWNIMPQSPREASPASQR